MKAETEWLRGGADSQGIQYSRSSSAAVTLCGQLKLKLCSTEDCEATHLTRFSSGSFLVHLNRHETDEANVSWLMGAHAGPNRGKRESKIVVARIVIVLWIIRLDIGKQAWQCVVRGSFCPVSFERAVCGWFI